MHDCFFSRPRTLVSTRTAPMEPVRSVQLWRRTHHGSGTAISQDGAGELGQDQGRLLSHVLLGVRTEVILLDPPYPAHTPLWRSTGPCTVPACTCMLTHMHIHAHPHTQPRVCTSMRPPTRVQEGAQQHICAHARKCINTRKGVQGVLASERPGSDRSAG